MANIQEVAKEAGVSVATVSRVMNGGAVTPKTKGKVEEVIKRLNYEPSMLGRNLRNSESRLLLVLIPTISNPYYSDIINGIENTVIRQGYNILLCETDSNPERENIYFDMVRKKMADGIISMDPTVNMEELKILAEDHPIIQCSEYSVESGIPFVTIDNEEAAYRAVSHLVNIGRTDIAMINSDVTFLYARQRQLGYQRALEEKGVPFDEGNVYYTNGPSFERGQQAMRKILTDHKDHSAVFAVSDLLAIGALKEAHQLGLRVPEDIAIAGFDKIAFSNMTNPALTTIAQPMYDMGTTSAQMLIDKINGRTVESTMMSHELIIRESTIG
ncbi:LacI family DNA-binding transcriptional regulator [Salibacterium halotolerans]|uniref:Alanine racemase n=1 Tax=Salibacterium halotolerans TaxID=1884432 RepID=A0A1I5V9Q2_9BACI|nr:LacI family DNA-binding transcriptional regulator [Salibacterium halotolerans]SFQ04225.1 alanine racemase [Salibacterium halotolerans]